jgi:phenylpropionate dioxygenase-like ring-hydroxylating dioxygenase large terminal subunit
MTDVPGFDRTAVRLPMFRVEQWLGFVFVNLDADAAPLRPGLAGVEANFTNHDIGDAISVAEYHKVWAGNWKLAVENASESLHHMGLHSESLEPYMPGRSTYVREITDHWAQIRTPILPDVAAKYGMRMDYPTRLTTDDRAEMKTVTVFPAFQLITVADLILWFSFRPLAVDRIDAWSGALFPPSALAAEPDLERVRADLQRSLNVVNAEDERAMALLQRSASSRYATRGCLSAKEDGLGGFHRYLARQLSGA